jgi:hypothetical protein
MKITEKRLLDCGFSKREDDIVEYMYNYRGVDVWYHGGGNWIIEMLDQARINIEYRTMGELNVFFFAINMPLNFT